MLLQNACPGVFDWTIPVPSRQGAPSSRIIPLAVYERLHRVPRAERDNAQQAIRTAQWRQFSAQNAISPPSCSFSFSHMLITTAETLLIQLQYRLLGTLDHFLHTGIKVKR